MIDDPVSGFGFLAGPVYIYIYINDYGGEVGKAENEGKATEQGEGNSIASTILDISAPSPRGHRACVRATGKRIRRR